MAVEQKSVGWPQNKLFSEGGKSLFQEFSTSPKPCSPAHTEDESLSHNSFSRTLCYGKQSKTRAALGSCSLLLEQKVPHEGLRVFGLKYFVNAGIVLGVSGLLSWWVLVGPARQGN